MNGQTNGMPATEMASIAGQRKGINTMSLTHMTQDVNINRELVGAALYRQRQAARGDARRTTAINRAALNLEACPWTYDQSESELVIISASDPGRRYHITPNGCDCQASRANRPCWHGAAYQIVNTAFGIGKQRQAAERPAHVIAEINAAADSLYA